LPPSRTRPAHWPPPVRPGHPTGPRRPRA
jgi:hypothetical protein